MLTFNQWIRYRLWPRNKFMVGCCLMVIFEITVLPWATFLICGSQEAAAAARGPALMFGMILTMVCGGGLYACFIKGE